MPEIVISSDLIVTERAGYALLKCKGCETYLLIAGKDFGYESGFVCKGCNNG